MTNADQMGEIPGNEENHDKAKSPEQIEVLLRDRNSDLWNRTSRCVHNYTVALLTLPRTGSAAPAPAGSGTLVKVADSHYILTAAHVWQERLKTSPQIGLTLTPGIDHCTPIETLALTPFLLPYPQHSEAEQWGPDVVFLKIPAFSIGAIQAFKSFYPIGGDKHLRKSTGVEYRYLAGAPGAFASTVNLNTTLRINAFQADLDAAPYTRGEYDYIDLKENVRWPDYPSNFKGVSGGGLWRVQIFGSPNPDGIDWSCFLEGLAFYQLPVEGGKEGDVIVRCHGEKTIRLALARLTN